MGTEYSHKDILVESAAAKNGIIIRVGTRVWNSDERYGLYRGRVEALYERKYDGFIPPNGGPGPWAKVRVDYTKSGDIPWRLLQVETRHLSTG